MDLLTTYFILILLFGIKLIIYTPTDLRNSIKQKSPWSDA